MNADVSCSIVFNQFTARILARAMKLTTYKAVEKTDNEIASNVGGKVDTHTNSQWSNVKGNRCALKIKLTMIATMLTPINSIILAH